MCSMRIESRRPDLWYTFTLHGTRTGNGTRINRSNIVYYAEMFTVVRDRDRDQDPLFPFMPAQFPVPVPAKYSVNKSIKSAIIFYTLWLHISK